MGKIGGMGKHVKRVLVVLLLLVTVVFGSELLLIIKINMTEEKVEKRYFSNHYFIEATNEKGKIDNFKEFMLGEGWKFIENYNDTIIFKKGNLQKEVQLNKLIRILNYKDKSK